MRFGCPRVAARRKRAYSGKENPFGKDKDVACDTRQGPRSAAGSDWTDHKAEIRSIRPLHRLRLMTTGREMTGCFGVVRMVSQQKKGLYFLHLA